MTGLEKLIKANRWRVKTGKYGTDETAGWNGLFIVPMEGELWSVILSDRNDWRHLSISNGQRTVVPPHNVLTKARDLFFADEEWVVQFFPPAGWEVFLTNSEPVLHLWSPINDRLPYPGETHASEKKDAPAGAQGP